MFDTLLAQMCTLLALNSSGFIPSNPMCVPVFKALTMESDLHQNMDLTEKYFVENGTRMAYSTFGENNLKAAGGLIYLDNMYKSQRIQLQAPLQPFADNINLTLYQNYCNVMMNWHWSFK